MLQCIAVFFALLVIANAAVAAPREVRAVRFEIDMRAEIAAKKFDPLRDKVGVRGAALPLSWDVTTVGQALGDGRFAVEVQFDRSSNAGQPLQYKFKVDNANNAARTAGWEDGRNHTLSLQPASQTVARAFDAPHAPLVLSRTGNIERLAAAPSKFVQPREVQVWLPPDYDKEPQRRYPVLYLHDGQNMFDASQAGAEWQLDETAQRLILAKQIAPIIIVAVASSENRVGDYTPTSAWMPSGFIVPTRAGGSAANYAKYLTTELKPVIDQRYRSKPLAADTAVGGASLGGLVSLWLVLHHGDIFGNALVVSPSLWWDDELMLQDVRKLKPLVASAQILRPKIWLDIGGKEGEAALLATRRMQAALSECGWDSKRLAYLEQPDGTHDEAAWAQRVEPMLRFIYGGQR